MKDYLKLLRFVKPYKAIFAFAVFCMGCSAIFDGVSLAMMVPLADKVLTNKKIIVPTKLPDFLAALVDKINSISPETMLNYMVVIVILLFLLKGIFEFMQSYCMSDIGQRVVRDIKSRLYTKIQSLSLDYFTHKRGGELMSRITNDVRIVENAVSYGSTDLIYQSLQVVIFATVIFFIYFKMALVAFIFLPLISLPIVRVGKVLRKLSRRSQEKIADTNSLLYETIMGARIVKAFNMEEHEIGKFNKVNSDYYKICMKTIKRSLLLSPSTEFLGVLAGVLVFFWGGREVIAGRLSFGVFGLFLGSLLSLVRPFKKLSQVNALNQQAMAASERIHEVLETEPSVKDPSPAVILDGFKKSVKFSDIRFSYADAEVLKGINLEVEYGQMLAIVGPSGSGKSTLVDLIPRFYDPQSGKVLIDGTDIRRFSLNSLRSQIGIVSQETLLFNDTIRANISYGKPGSSSSEVEEAAKKAHAHDFILKCPQGYDTVIGDRGVMLSGGERQRIAIARALLKDAPILILDEATSQLDSTSERIVQEALDRLVSGRTVFMIAHRLSTVRNANRIVVLDKGEIAEDGTHSQLLEKNGLYRRLYAAQELQ
ncbi:MAG: ABC transporter ATP-binding protein, partial [Candidatus Omnitrophica bacterium]|jgi:subfamily B ATP-binding cassette protein MsbA|nr:ABC transporter ATP-binding protein/permease [Candidatus Omnitrophota bacterium]MDD3274837.1 ABC transporter ATP-binding protein [Candidatus Omnitrophota bacterium]MDD5078250.1 ABC transporter ATP-binding protein [Candidatus Omnitrophota bacterium]MDD5724946.1 ABC transporter ATP-binding protein [Candidatus Omnitrophota bacterium]